MRYTDNFLYVPSSVGTDFVMIQQDDSMINAGITKGSIVCFRSQDIIENGGIYAVKIDGNILLRQIYDHGEIIVLTPQNPAYALIILTKEEKDTLHIIGQATHCINDII